VERPRSVAMAWFRADDYPQVRSGMDDAARLPASYQAWLLSAEQVESEIVRSGVAVERVYLEPDAFLAWCAETGAAPNGAARARYAEARLSSRRP
jgi:hypothetical protein